ncbi:MAG: NAD-dependent epimerase/dehydratase family protein [Planctomycetota bacterium]
MARREKILVTGGAGFIGFHVVKRLLEEGRRVLILDNLDPFYDPDIKIHNLAEIEDAEFVECDIRLPVTHRDFDKTFAGIDAVIHLAALAGVRPSIERPAEYMDVNVRGTQVLLNNLRARNLNVPFIFGSSSSVYGGNTKVPFMEDDSVDTPISPYAASKRAGELLCHTHHHLTGAPVTCLRFFTVFGPRQRPEMAIHKFSRLIMAAQPIPFFGDGSTRRDYTYVDDIVDGVVAALDRAKGYRIYNLGGSETTTLGELVSMLEEALNRKAVLDQRPEQPGDVRQTHADITRAQRELDYQVKVPVAVGLQRFTEWYLDARAAGRLP